MPPPMATFINNQWSHVIARERRYHVVAEVIEIDSRLAGYCSLSRDYLSDPFIVDAIFRTPCGLDQRVCEILHCRVDIREAR